MNHKATKSFTFQNAPFLDVIEGVCSFQPRFGGHLAIADRQQLHRKSISTNIHYGFARPPLIVKRFVLTQTS